MTTADAIRALSPALAWAIYVVDEQEPAGFLPTEHAMTVEDVAIGYVSHARCCAHLAAPTQGALARKLAAHVAAVAMESTP